LLELNEILNTDKKYLGKKGKELKIIENFCHHSVLKTVKHWYLN